MAVDRVNFESATAAGLTRSAVVTRTAEIRSAAALLVATP